MKDLPSLSEDSLFGILKERADTSFDGHRIEEDKASRSRQDIYYSENHNPVISYNDHVRRKYREGRPVGILIADYDAKSIQVDHPYEYLPHVIGLFVRKEYRNQGIATEMIEEFLDKVERERFVVDCEEDKKSFYRQTEGIPIFLEKFKSR